MGTCNHVHFVYIINLVGGLRGLLRAITDGVASSPNLQVGTGLNPKYTPRTP